jgi:hypothetical protein
VVERWLHHRPRQGVAEAAKETAQFALKSKEPVVEAGKLKVP